MRIIVRESNRLDNPIGADWTRLGSEFPSRSSAVQLVGGCNGGDRTLGFRQCPVVHAESSFRHGIGSYGPIETVTGSVGR
jgi:hypothetical protein